MTRFQLCVRVSLGGVARVGDWTVGPYRTAVGEVGWAVCDQHGLATFCGNAADAVDAFIGWLDGKVLPERWAPEPAKTSAGNIAFCDAWLDFHRASA